MKLGRQFDTSVAAQHTLCNENEMYRMCNVSVQYFASGLESSFVHLHFLVIMIMFQKFSDNDILLKNLVIFQNHINPSILSKQLEILFP